MVSGSCFRTTLGSQQKRNPESLPQAASQASVDLVAKPGPWRRARAWRSRVLRPVPGQGPPHARAPCHLRDGRNEQCLKHLGELLRKPYPKRYTNIYRYTINIKTGFCTVTHFLIWVGFLQVDEIILLAWQIRLASEDSKSNGVIQLAGTNLSETGWGIAK